MAFLKPDSIEYIDGVKVNTFLLTKHNPNKIALPTAYIKNLIGVTIHNTDAIKAANGTTMAEQYSRATYNGNMNNVVVHYYVDDVEAWQIMPLNIQTWHAADGNGPGNTQTISIEVIGNSAKAEENAAKLAAYLLKFNNLNTSNLYTHTYWLNVRDNKGANLSKDARCVLVHSYKTCPAYIIPHWPEFVKKVNSYMSTQRGRAIELANNIIKELNELLGLIQ